MSTSDQSVAVAETPPINCRWDFCTETFVTFPEWETHFAIEHIAYAKPVDLAGRRQRKRGDGSWELVDREQHATDQLGIDPHASQTTGDITTTTHTLSFPVPPSFHSLPEALGSMPTDMILPPRTLDPYDDVDLRRPRDTDPDGDGDGDADADADAADRIYKGVYQTFINSPSPPPGQSGSASGSGSGSGSTGVLPPPPGQRPRTPPSSQSLSQPHSQPASDPASTSTPVSAGSQSFRVPYPPSFASPSQGQSTPNRASDTSQVSQGRARADSTSSQAGQGPLSLRFGAALGNAEVASPRREMDSPSGLKGAGVGFSWGGR